MVILSERYWGRWYENSTKDACWTIRVRRVRLAADRRSARLGGADRGNPSSHLAVRRGRRAAGLDVAAPEGWLRPRHRVPVGHPSENPENHGGPRCPTRRRLRSTAATSSAAPPP